MFFNVCYVEEKGVNKMRFNKLYLVLALVGVMLLSLLNISLVKADETDPPQLPGFVEGVGTYFEVTDSEYLNITVESSESIFLSLESIPTIISMNVEAASDATSTVLTISGLEANTYYWKYEDELLNPEQLTTDADGNVTFIQNLSTKSHVWFQSERSTIHLDNASTGGECYLVGYWDSTTKTCTLNQNVNDTIEIKVDGITLDGDDYEITPHNYGIVLSGTKLVTLKNLNLIGEEGTGIALDHSSYTLIENNTLSGFYHGVFLYQSDHNTVIRNKISDSFNDAIFVRYDSDYNIFRDNTFDTTLNRGNGVYLLGYYDCSNPFSCKDHKVRNNGIYNNNFVSIPRPLIVLTGQDNFFQLDPPVGGNYYSKFDDPGEGCNNNDNDQFCDSTYYFTGGYDLYPWTMQDGWINQPPIITAESNITVNEGDTASNTVTVSDPDGDSVTLSASSIGTVTNNGDGTWSWSFDTSDGSAESQTVTITANDGNGGTAQTSFELTVTNIEPTIDTIVVPPTPVDINNQPISVSGNFTDPAGDNDRPYTCTVDYGDGNGAQTGTITATTCTGPDQNYAEPGVYQITMTVTDKDGGTGSVAAADLIVIYNPAGGFVTGGGWIMSPQGACQFDACTYDSTGKANFGFVSKYKKGAKMPTGRTEFQFKAGNLNFHSSSYEWLVIAGPNAKYKGEGTINGSGNYGFMLTATDSEVNGGGEVDTFRIKIWDKDNDGLVVYDNKMDVSDDSYDGTELGGGNIKVHKGKKGK
jgi:parallel beta-helix repeat protein